MNMLSLPTQVTGDSLASENRQQIQNTLQSRNHLQINVMTSNEFDTELNLVVSENSEKDDSSKWPPRKKKSIIIQRKVDFDEFQKQQKKGPSANRLSMDNIKIENRLIKPPQVTKLSFSNQPQFLGLGELDQLPDPSKMMMRKGHSTMARRATVNDHKLCFNQIKGLGPVKCGITGEMHH